MNTKVYELLNEQINKEFYSAYLYLDMSNFLAEMGLNGFANWYRIQAKEEQAHAMFIYDYLQDNDQKVVLEAIAKPERNFDSILSIAKESLAHEQYVTKSINEIYNAAVEAKDYRTTQFLDWFIKEQGEEEKSATDMINSIELFGDDKNALYMLNNEYGSRVYTEPVLEL